MQKNSSLNLGKLDYQCLLINSPKTLADYEKTDPNEERNFLDYQFSKARSKSGTEQLNTFNLINVYSPLIRKMCQGQLTEDNFEEGVRRETKIRQIFSFYRFKRHNSKWL